MQAFHKEPNRGVSVPWSREKIWAFLKSDVSLSSKRKQGEIEEERPEAARAEAEPKATQAVEKGPSKPRWAFLTRKKTSGSQLQENVAKDTPRQKSSGKATQQKAA